MRVPLAEPGSPKGRAGFPEEMRSLAELEVLADIQHRDSERRVSVERAFMWGSYSKPWG